MINDISSETFLLDLETPESLVWTWPAAPTPRRDYHICEGAPRAPQGEGRVSKGLGTPDSGGLSNGTPVARDFSCSLRDKINGHDSDEHVHERGRVSQGEIQENDCLYIILIEGIFCGVR